MSPRLLNWAIYRVMKPPFQHWLFLTSLKKCLKSGRGALPPSKGGRGETVWIQSSVCSRFHFTPIELKTQINAQPFAIFKNIYRCISINYNVVEKFIYFSNDIWDDFGSHLTKTHQFTSQQIWIWWHANQLINSKHLQSFPEPSKWSLSLVH